MWLKKRAIYPKNKKGYMGAVGKIVKDYKLSKSDIDTFYKEAISKEILEAANKHLSKYYSQAKISNTFAKQAIDYFHNPTKKNRKKLVELIKTKLARRSVAIKQFSAYKFVNEISFDFGIGIMGDVFDGDR